MIASQETKTSFVYIRVIEHPPSTHHLSKVTCQMTPASVGQNARKLKSGVSFQSSVTEMTAQSLQA